MNRCSAVLVAVAVVLGLAGCGTSAPATTALAPVATSTSPTAAPTPTEEPGPQAFLALIRVMDYGDKDMNSGTDDQLLGLGNSVCAVLETQPSFGNAVQVMVKIAGNPTVAQAQTLVRESVVNLCPQHKYLLP